MATPPAFSTLHSISTLNARRISSNSLIHPVKNLHFQIPTNSFKPLTLKNGGKCKNWNSRGMSKLRSVEEETLVPEAEQQEEAAGEEVEQAEQPTISVPVSPSDTLTMYFQAEGILDETSIPKVTKALEATEGISDLKVEILEGIASVQLKKETTIQATGVASNLIELIQGSGFKLQTLNLSFEDEEDVLV